MNLCYRYYHNPTPLLYISIIQCQYLNCANLYLSIHVPYTVKVAFTLPIIQAELSSSQTLAFRIFSKVEIAQTPQWEIILRVESV
jgi:hypothetical protein